ncbi:MAG: alpha-glucan family phosphorylase, partial [Bacteroidia bacterium]
MLRACFSLLKKKNNIPYLLHYQLSTEKNMTSNYAKWYHPYTPDERYQKRAAYFCMEYAIHQSLKIYSGGLGYLAGSHLRSAFELKQNMIAIGILWSYGYYDQTRDENGLMKPAFTRKDYAFLEDTGIKVTISVNHHPVHVKVYCLPSHVFNTAPLYLLSTDIPENDALSRTITQRLYDGNTLTRIAQMIVLGVGGAKVIEALGGTDIYHMNESHALPLLFYMYEKYGNVEEVKKRYVFTTHTPEKAGNEEHNIHDLNKLSFFGNVPLEEAKRITGTEGDMFGHTPAALHLAKIANGVSQLHAVVSKEMWSSYAGISDIIGITNAQNFQYWADKDMYMAMEQNNDGLLLHLKRQKKKELFKVIADQCGKIFDENALTIVWARRFAGYKRADLLLTDLDRLDKFLNNIDRPVQLVFAGKPYPLDQAAISIFNLLIEYSRDKKNVAVVLG